MSMLEQVELAGDFEDGSHGWVDWSGLVRAAAALEEVGSASSGVRAALQLARALTSCTMIDSLDEHNRSVARQALEALVLSL